MKGGQFLGEIKGVPFACVPMRAGETKCIVFWVLAQDHFWHYLLRTVSACIIPSLVEVCLNLLFLGLDYF